MSSGWCGMRMLRGRPGHDIPEEWLVHSDSHGLTQPSVNLGSSAQAHIAAVLLVAEGSPFEPGIARGAFATPFALDASFQANSSQFWSRRSSSVLR